VSFSSRLFGIFGFIFGSNLEEKETETGMTTFLSHVTRFSQKPLFDKTIGEREREREGEGEGVSEDLIVLITCVSCLPYAQGSSEEDRTD